MNKLLLTSSIVAALIFGIWFVTPNSAFSNNDISVDVFPPSGDLGQVASGCLCRVEIHMRNNTYSDLWIGKPTLETGTSEDFFFMYSLPDNMPFPSGGHAPSIWVHFSSTNIQTHTGMVAINIKNNDMTTPFQTVEVPLSAIVIDPIPPPYPIIQLTNTLENEYGHMISDNGSVLWIRSVDPDELWLYDGSTSSIFVTAPNLGTSSINANGDIVWSEYVGVFNWKIMLFKDSITSTIASGLQNPPHGLQIAENGHVVWMAHDGNDDEVFLHDGSTTNQITDNDVHDLFPDINAFGHIVWVQLRSTGSRVYLYDGNNMSPISNDHFSARYPQISNNGHVVWRGYEGPGEYSIFLYNPSSSSPSKIVEQAYIDYVHMNDNGHVVWEANDGVNPVLHVYLYDGSVKKITEEGHRYASLRPRINNLGYIVWSGWDGRDGEIYLHNGSTTTNISDNCNRDILPEINNRGEIIWIGDDGTGKREVFLVRIPEDADGDGVPDDQDECPAEDATGFDADGDGCIDSFEGLTDIIDTLVEAGVIDEQMRNSLISKIENASNSADRDNICAAVNQLEAFKNQIDAQRDKKISDEAADLLIDYADNLIAHLLSQLAPGDTC